MAIPLDELKAMLTRARRASSAVCDGNVKRTGGWEARGGQATPATWTRTKFIRKVCAGLRDVAYFPERGPGKREEDVLFVADARSDVPRLVREWQEIHEILTRRGEPVSVPITVAQYLQQAPEISARATAGPWHDGFTKEIDLELLWKDRSLAIVVLAGGGDICHVHPAGAEEGLCDAQFIAYARHAVPFLAAEVLKLRQKLEVGSTESEPHGLAERGLEAGGQALTDELDPNSEGGPADGYD